MSSGAANEQWGNQLKLMEIQNRYNEQMAKNNQQRNKDLWDYTNYENQKQHMKNAGLNPALMYGMGGGGGVSASGAQGQGVTQPTDRSVEMGLKQQGLGLQLASIASQVELNKSQAEERFTRYFGEQTDSDLRRITREDTPHTVKAFWI